MANPIDECHFRIEDAIRVLKIALDETDAFALRSHLLLAAHHIDSAVMELHHPLRRP